MAQFLNRLLGRLLLGGVSPAILLLVVAVVAMVANPQTAWLIGVTALASLLISILAAFLIARQVQRPIDQLQEAAGQLVAGQFTSVFPHGPREIARLMEQFNRMGQIINNREQAIRELNNHLLERTMELTAANQEMESFSYSVSHDLRAPLRGMDGFSQALLEDFGSQLPDRARDYLGRVRAASQRMGHLIDDLLTLSRLSRADMNRIEVDLTQMGRALLEEMQQAEPQRTVEAVVSDGLVACGDPRLLHIALENLLGNAWKYTTRQETARIELGKLDGKAPVVFFVRDNGAGFDMAYAGKLFAPFQRLHPLKDYPGSGIGLATARRIIHRHGGQVWAESAVGQGATFYFTLGPPEGGTMNDE